MQERFVFSRPLRAGRSLRKERPMSTSHAESLASSNRTESAGWRPEFLAMLPAIESRARLAFRFLKGDDRDEAVQETICNACCAFARLAEQGRPTAATAASLAAYGVAQVRAGRRVGGTLNVNDVCSTHCRLRKGVVVQALLRQDDRNGQWREILVEDRRATPAELAASRIDFDAFLQTLNRRERRVAETLATGESTSRAAELAGVSPGRISQLRRELKTAWERFHEPSSVPAAA